MTRLFSVRSAQLGVIAGVVALGATVMGPTSASAAGRAAAPSSSLAGYLVTKTKAHIHSASATFKIPTITCKKNESGVGPAVIVETAPHANVFHSDASAVAVACVNKSPVYESIITVNDTEYPNDFTDLQPGDKVLASVTIGPRKTVVKFDDVTRNESETKTGATSSSVDAWICATSLAVGNNTGKKQIGIDPFTTLAVSHASVNGHSLGSESPRRYNWVVNGTTLVTASRLKNGSSFTATFKHSN